MMTKTKTVFLVCISAIILILLEIELSAVCMISPFQIQHLNVFTKQNDNQCNIFFAWMKLKKNYWGKGISVICISSSWYSNTQGGQTIAVKPLICPYISVCIHYILHILRQWDSLLPYVHCIYSRWHLISTASAVISNNYCAIPIGSSLAINVLYLEKDTWSRPMMAHLWSCTLLWHLNK